VGLLGWESETGILANNLELCRLSVTPHFDYTRSMELTLNNHIEITPGVCGGKPRVAGHRIRVQDIAVWHEMQGQSPDEIVGRFPQLSLADVHAALAYYFDHREEILGEIRQDADFVTALKSQLGPGPLARKLGPHPRDS
jgi:uncharacterized protein (DUF433 family)